MKTLICIKPGELEYKDTIAEAWEPGYTLLRIRRIGICGTDLHAFEGTQPFFQYPRILGHELAGEIVETDLPDFTKGEIVTFIPYFQCGNCIACRNGKPNCCTSIKVCGVHVDGGMREILKVPSDAIVKGHGLGTDELALIEPLSIGAHSLRRAAIQPNEYVLVIGAGPIGLGIAELAKIAGARVIVMDINEARLNFCKQKLGINYTINATTTELHKKIEDLTNGDMPTLVIDATGNLKAINIAFNFIAHGGRYVLVGLQKGNIEFSHPEFHKREATLMSSRNATREDFDHVIRLMKEKKIDPSTYITHRVGFDEVKDNFESWLRPETGVIKAMVSFD